MGSLLAGRSGVAPTTIFNATGFPTQISAEVKNWDISSVGEDPELWKKRGRHSRFAGGAARQAVDDSGVLDSIDDPTRFGIYLGAGEGSQDFDAFCQMMAAGLKDGDFDVGAFCRRGLEILDPMAELEQEPNMPSLVPGRHVQRPGPKLQLPDRLCRQQPGHWRSRPKSSVAARPMSCSAAARTA